MVIKKRSIIVICDHLEHRIILVLIKKMYSIMISEKLYVNILKKLLIVL